MRGTLLRAAPSPRPATTETMAQVPCALQRLRRSVLQIFMPAIPFTARRMASGVAGASSAGICPGLRLAIASKIAVQTEMPSISGGSPTALER